MNGRISSVTLALLPFLLFSAAGVVAQTNTRVFVSSTGNDSADCSRTTPCRTFAGALPKVAAGGEIIVVDAGNYSSVTITKSVSIIAKGQYAGVRGNAGADGILIEAGMNDSVRLYGLTINGTGAGANGIRISGGAVVIESCSVQAFSGAGILVESRGSVVKVLIKDTLVSETALNGVGSGVIVNSATAVILEDARLWNNNNGIRVNSGSVTIRNSSVSGSRASGIIVSGGFASIVGSSITNNGVGVNVVGTVQLSNNLIAGNDTGLSGNGTIGSYRNNQIFGNRVDGRPNGTVTAF